MKTIYNSTCMFILCVCANLTLKAQQVAKSPLATVTATQLANSKKVGDYLYRINPAANNSFGYVIFQNGKMLFQQPPLKVIANNGTMYFAKRNQTEMAALLSIEKLKKGVFPALNAEDIRKLSFD